MNPLPDNAIQNRSITRRLTASLIITVFIVSVISVTAMYRVLSQAAISGLEQKADEALAHLVGSLEMPLWTVDEEGIKNIGNAVSHDESIVRLIVRNESGTVVYSIEKEYRGDLTHRFGKIFHKQWNRANPAGDVSVSLTSALYNENNRRLLFFAMFIIVLVLISIAIVTILFIRTALNRTLKSLNEITNSFSAGIYDTSEHTLPYLEFQPFGRALVKMAEKVERQIRKVQEAEAKYRDIFENAIEGIFQSSVEGRFLKTNPALVKILGYDSVDEFTASVGDISRDLYVNPEEFDKLRSLLLARGAVAGYEVQLRHKDEQAIWASISAHLVRDKAGIQLFVEGFIADITERKHTEDALRERETFLNTLLNAIPIPLFYKDREGRYLGFNRAFETFFGATKEQLIGKSVFEINPPEQASTYHARDTELFESGGNQQYETQVKNMHGALRDVIFDKAVFTDSLGAVSGLIGTILDVTERKQAVKNLAERMMLAELSSEIGCALTMSGDLRNMLNDCAQSLVGHLDAAFARIWTLNAAENVLELQASAGMYTRTDGSHRRMPVGNFKIGLIAEERKPVLTNEVIGDPLISDQEWAKREGMVSFAGHPLMVEEKLVGVMALFSRHALTDTTLKALASVSNEIAIGIERKQAEKALRASEELFRTTVENVPVILYRLDSDGVFQLSVGAGLAKLGLKPGEVVGRSVFELYKDFPEIVASHRYALAGDMSRYTTEVAGNVFETSLLPVLGMGGEVQAVVGVGSDITERKLMEQERLSQLKFFENMDKVNQAIQGTNDLEKMMRDVLDRVLSIFDCDRAWLVYPCDLDAPSWRTPMERTRPQYPGALAQGLEVPMDPEVLGVFRTVTTSDGPVSFGAGFKDPLPDGVAEQFGIRSMLSMAIYPKFDKPYMFGIHQCSHLRVWTRDEERLFKQIGRRLADGLTSLLAYQELRKLNEELEKRVKNRTDELEVMNAEIQESQTALMNIVEDLNGKTAELKSANERLKDLDRLKSMFIASMSHELRTPLNSIIGFSSIMLDEWAGPVTAEQKENLSAVLRSGKHLLSLINDVIDVSKIEVGRIESIPEEFDVCDVVMEAVETLKEDIENKKLELKVHAPRQVLHTDRRRVLQCLLNLVSNAVKYTSQGSIHVSAELSTDGSMMTLAVEDTGVGIREEDLDRLFLPFGRLTPPLGRIIPGTGLGLYLTKKLAREILRGDIVVTSTYGTGSRFSLRVPTAG